MSRLIDADALKKDLSENYVFYGFRQLLNDFYEALDDAPTIDAVEVVRGEWIYHFDDIWPEESTIQCSLCREHQPLGIDENFCPNCGAMMKGSDDEV